jgi:hypothetical protein
MGAAIVHASQEEAAAVDRVLPFFGPVFKRDTGFVLAGCAFEWDILPRQSRRSLSHAW